MNITKFKLISSGVGGIEVQAIEGIRQKNMIILDHVTRVRELPIPKPILEKINSLKYFYLNLTSHWIEPYNKYFDLNKYEILPPEKNASDGKMPKAQQLLYDIWNHTRITGATVKSGGFVITGDIEVVEGKKIGIPTPFITEEDDVSFYIMTMEKIDSIMNEISDYLTSHALPEHVDKDMMLALGARIVEDERLTDDQMEERLLDRFIEKGIIVMVDSESSEKHETKLHTGTGVIDSDKMEEVTEEKEEEEEIVNEEIEEKKPIVKLPKGNLVSDKGFPDMSGDVPVEKTDYEKETDLPVQGDGDGGNISDLEYSQDLGMEQKVEDEDKGNSSMSREDVMSDEDEPVQDEKFKAEW